VDFNCGLDANLLTEHKARQLARINIQPARVAFDHIYDREKYLRAATLLAQAGIGEISNYLLYNAPDFSGKGKPRRADLPQDLYERMAINVDFAERSGVSVYSCSLNATAAIVQAHTLTYHVLGELAAARGAKQKSSGSPLRKRKYSCNTSLRLLESERIYCFFCLVLRTTISLSRKRISPMRIAATVLERLPVAMK
jgi:hypothetical protein